MRSSYRAEDVTLLLKDITGLVEPLPAKEREKRIQSGTHYCEMLPAEYVPTPPYMEAYRRALATQADATAAAVRQTADRLAAEKGDAIVLVSLARAGIPVGILLKWDLRARYGIDAPHYAVSIDPDVYAQMAHAVNPYGDGQTCARIVQAIAHRFGLCPDGPAPFTP